MPKVFISSTTLGLGPYREIVSEVLIVQGFKPIVQEYFDTPDCPIIHELREKIADAQRVIALVGPFYGTASPADNPRLPGMKLSYTQFELEFALHYRKPTLVLFAGPRFNPEATSLGNPPTQSESLAKLQTEFIRWIKARADADAGRSVFNDRFELAMALAKIDWRTWR